VAFEPGCDALDRRRWNDEDAPARPEHRHAERPAGHIQRESALGAPSQRNGELELASISPPRMLRQGPPARDTTPSAAVGSPSRADHRGHSPGGELYPIESRCGGRSVPVDAKQGDVRGRVTPATVAATCTPESPTATSPSPPTPHRL
jgi:hypothetical protein